MRRRVAGQVHLALAHARVQREGRAVAGRGTPLLVSILVERRSRQDRLAAIDLRAEIHLGILVGRQRRQTDRDGRGRGASAGRTVLRAGRREEGGDEVQGAQ